MTSAHVKQVIKKYKKIYIDELNKIRVKILDILEKGDIPVVIKQI